MVLSPPKKCLIFGITGLAVCILGVVLGWVVVPNVVRNKIAEILPLRKDSESWERWKDVPVPIHFRIYIFNVNNPDEIVKGETPNITEVGPYVYREYRNKTILSYDEENGSVTYQQRTLFEFDKEASKELSEEDELTILNLPALLFPQILENIKHFSVLASLCNTALPKIWPSSNPMFVKVRVKDLLFEGTPVLCNQSLSQENVDTRLLCEAFRQLKPRTATLDYKEKNVHSFAFFKYKNDSHDGTYEIDLGIGDVTKIGLIKSWNNKTQLSDWGGESCNRISGTDSTVFRPYLEQDDVTSLSIYHTDVCRSLKLNYVGDTTFKGVKGRRYAGDKDLLASVLENNDNYCYCPQSIKGITHYGGCLKSGALELSSCQGAPILISYPHFLMADTSLKGKIVGLNPELEKHQTFVDLEPNTGYPLRAACRIQINGFLKSISGVELTSKFTDVLMPVVWLEETVELTDEFIDVINSQLLNILTVADIVRWLLVAIGSCLSLGAVGYYVKLRLRQKEE